MSGRNEFSGSYYPAEHLFLKMDVEGARTEDIWGEGCIRTKRCIVIIYGGKVVKVDSQEKVTSCVLVDVLPSQ